MSTSIITEGSTRIAGWITFSDGSSQYVEMPVPDIYAIEDRDAYVIRRWGMESAQYDEEGNEVSPTVTPQSVSATEPS